MERAFENFINVLDVSSHQGKIDFDVLKNEGYDNIIIRLGFRGWGTGEIVVDTQAERNLAEAKSHGFGIGAYFHSQAISEEEAIEEAEFCNKILTGYKLDLPVFYDYEGYDKPERRSYGQTKEQRTDYCIVFCNTIAVNCTYLKGNAGLYCSQYSINNEWNWKLIKDSTVGIFWVARYNTIKPATDCPYIAWQYSSKLKVKGITGNTADISQFNSDWLLPKTETPDLPETQPEDEYAYTYKNGSTKETVYADIEFTVKVGSLNPYESCPCKVIEGVPCVLYDVDNTMNKKVGFVKYFPDSLKKQLGGEA